MNSRPEPSPLSQLFSSPVASVCVQGETAQVLPLQMQNVGVPACSSGQTWPGGDLVRHRQPGQKQLQIGHILMLLTDAEHQRVGSQTRGHLCVEWQQAAPSAS